MASKFLNSVQRFLKFGVGAGVTAWYKHSCSLWAKPGNVPGPCGRLFETLSASPAPETADYEAHAKNLRPFSTGHTAFTFGPGDSYIFAIRTNDVKASIWQSRASLTSFSSFQKDGLGDLYWCAYTPHGDELLAYEDANTKQSMYIFHRHLERPDQAPSYHSLLRWLGKNISPTHSALMHLENIILDKKESYAKDGEPDNTGWIPRIVALGANDAWIAVWEDDRCASSLSSATASRKR